MSPQSPHLLLEEPPPNLRDATLLIGLTGWMNGGNVSVGCTECLRSELGAMPVARIQPEVFYIYNFPGSMDVSAMFRPHVKIEEGLLKTIEPPANLFFASAEHNVVIFEGKEPNFHWREFAECFLTVIERFNVRRTYFVGSVAGVTPHTRDPRISASVSLPEIKDELAAAGIRFSNYEGPGSFITYLTALCTQRGLEMASLVAEIPAYIQGTNPRSIEAVSRKLAAMLRLEMSFESFRRVSDVFERKVNEVIAERPDLAELIHKLEGDYDSEVFDNEMGDLKIWLQEKGIRMD